MPDPTWLETVLRRQLAKVATDAALYGTVSNFAIDAAARCVLAALEDQAPGLVPEAAQHLARLEQECADHYGTLTIDGHGRTWNGRPST